MQITTSNGKSVNITRKLGRMATSQEVSNAVNALYNKVMYLTGGNNFSCHIDEQGLLGLALKACFDKRTRRLNITVTEQEK